MGNLCDHEKEMTTRRGEGPFSDETARTLAKPFLVYSDVNPWETRATNKQGKKDECASFFLLDRLSPVGKTTWVDKGPPKIHIRRDMTET